jgi:hypothetical protein
MFLNKHPTNFTPIGSFLNELKITLVSEKKKKCRKTAVYIACAVTAVCSADFYEFFFSLSFHGSYK